MVSAPLFARLLFLAIIIMLAVAACDGKDKETFSFVGIQPLVNGYHYEGWAFIKDSPISTGKFNVDVDGNLVHLDGRVIDNREFDTGTDLSSATVLFVTIEPPGDDSIPSKSHYLAGDVANLSAELSVGHITAIGHNFTTASGLYILATPSNFGDSQEFSGIWYLRLSSGLPTKTLELPTLPQGWKYEGWVVIEGIPVTTGKFIAPAAEDLAAPYSGPQEWPPYPGEDFLENPPFGLSFPIDIRGDPYLYLHRTFSR